MSGVLMVCGSRKWIDRQPIHDAISEAKSRGYFAVVHGDCRGADQLADSVARTLSMDVYPFPAKWSRFGPSAGPLRNASMIHQMEPTLLLAFPLPDSKGTWDAVRQARNARIRVVVYGDSKMEGVG